MKLYFVTKNRFKVNEAKVILKNYGVEVVQIKKDKIEPKNEDLLAIAKKNALNFAKELKKKVIVEDTGIFFHAYKNFPGNHPRMMFDLLGYKGLLRIMKNEKNRKAEFRTVVAFSDGKKIKTFVGKLKGRITEKVFGKNKRVMPYERIFIPDGYKKPLAFMPRKEKNLLSHRARAFMKLGDFYGKN